MKRLYTNIKLVSETVSETVMGDRLRLGAENILKKLKTKPKRKPQLVLYGETTLQRLDSLYKNKYMLFRFIDNWLEWDPVRRTPAGSKNPRKCRAWSIYGFVYLGLFAPVSVFFTLISPNIPMANKVLPLTLLPLVLMFCGLYHVTETHLDEIVHGFKEMKEALHGFGK